MNNLTWKNAVFVSNEYIDIRDAVIGRGKFSKLYRLISCMSPKCNVSIRANWEKDLKLQLTTDQWETIVSRSNYLSKCIRYKVIQMKILFRSYITPQKLMKMNSDVSDKCWQECGKTSTLIYLLWHCPETKAFWLKVRD